jgi:Transposase IS116/IS110/IS902 family
VEGTRSHGIGLVRTLRAEGQVVLEAGRPTRVSRRPGGKSDPADARRAARDALTASTPAQPREDGVREALRVLLLARCQMTTARTAAVNTFKALVLTAPDRLREQLRRLTTPAQTRRCRTLRTAAGQSIADQILRRELRRLARHIRGPDLELRHNQTALRDLVDEVMPALLDQPGVGPMSTAQLLVAWSRRGRFRSEAAFAALAGVVLSARIGQEPRQISHALEIAHADGLPVEDHRPVVALAAEGVGAADRLLGGSTGVVRWSGRRPGSHPVEDRAGRSALQDGPVLAAAGRMGLGESRACQRRLVRSADVVPKAYRVGQGLFRFRRITVSEPHPSPGEGGACGQRLVLVPGRDDLQLVGGRPGPTEVARRDRDLDLGFEQRRPLQGGVRWALPRRHSQGAVEGVPDGGGRGGRVPLGQAHQREARLGIPAGAMSGQQGVLGARDVSLVQADPTELAQRPPELAPEVGAQLPSPWLLDRRIRTWLTGLLDVEPYAVVRLFTSPRRAPSSGSDHCSPGGVLRRCVGPDWKIVNECAVRPQEASAAADAPAARATTRGSGSRSRDGSALEPLYR